MTNTEAMLEVEKWGAVVGSDVAPAAGKTP